MKTIGMIGGMSWESSAGYYSIINHLVKNRLGGFHSAKCILLSVDFAEIETLQAQGKWQESAGILAEAAQGLERGGADLLILCTNTMHKVAVEIQAAVRIPFLHVADAAAEKIKSCGIRRVGLLGTRFTMQEDFYTGRLSRQHNLEVIVPGAAQQDIVHRIIYDELVKGVVRPESKAQYLTIIDDLVNAGAEGVILGCTEIGMLVRDGDCRVPLFDTTQIHAEAAVEYALAAEG